MASTLQARTEPLLGRVAALLLVIDEWLERHRNWVPLLYAPVFLLACWAISATKLMWFDELASYYPARLPTVTELIRFFWEGLDVHTPTSALLMRTSIGVFGDNHIGIRAPYIFGFLMMSVGIFWFAAKRLPVSYAAAAMIFPAITSVRYYATEARPFAINLGLAAFALLAWRAAAENRRRTLGLIALFLCLSLSVSLHYYAVFVWIPFGLAELVRWKERGRPDWAVWAVLVLALSPLILFFPAIQTARAAYMGGFWAVPSLSQIENTYRSMLTLALAPMVAILLLWAALRRLLGPWLPLGSPPVVPTAERVLIGSLALLPAFIVPLSFLTGLYVDRYALSSIIGLSIFLVFVGATRSSGDRLLGFAMAGFVLFWFCFKSPAIARKQMGETGGYPFRTASPFSVRAWMPLIEQSSLPVAASPAVFFLQFQHYAPQSVGQRLYYLSSRAYAKQFEGIDTGDTNLTRFAQMLPLRIQDYDAFTAANRRFLLIAETTNPTWVVEKLRADGASLNLLKRQGTYFLFEVTL